MNLQDIFVNLSGVKVEDTVYSCRYQEAGAKYILTEIQNNLKHAIESHLYISMQSCHYFCAIFSLKTSLSNIKTE